MILILILGRDAYGKKRLMDNEKYPSSNGLSPIRRSGKKGAERRQMRDRREEAEGVEA